MDSSPKEVVVSVGMYAGGGGFADYYAPPLACGSCPERKRIPCLPPSRGTMMTSMQFFLKSQTAREVCETRRTKSQDRSRRAYRKLKRIRLDLS
mgnify:CR=1 FL=1